MVHAATSTEGLEAFQRKFQEAGIDASASFEALLSVTGFKQTDLAAEILAIRRLDGVAIAATTTYATMRSSSPLVSRASSPSTARVSVITR